MYRKLKREFKKYFDENPTIIRSPGRINLIGEHTDYNNGFVMPAAINYNISFAIGTALTDEVTIISLDMDDRLTFDVHDISNSQSPWGMYIKGVTSQFINQKLKIGGFNCVFTGDIPLGAGLSSSAALTCGLAFGINQIFKTGLSNWDLARIAQTAEQRYAKVNCGIMDQFANLFSQEKHFSMLDCQTLEYSSEKFPSKNTNIVLIDTKVKHSLASTEYNLRKQQCDLAVSLIKGNFPKVNSLREVTAKMISESSLFLGETLQRRAEFVIEENQRVLDGFEDIKNGNMAAFGEKMYRSHEGLKTKYSVSCEELDMLVESTYEHKEVIGARMMGGGFGGCTINLVSGREGRRFIGALSKKFKKQFGVTPAVYDINLSEGTRVE